MKLTKKEFLKREKRFINNRVGSVWVEIYRHTYGPCSVCRHTDVYTSEESFPESLGCTACNLANLRKRKEAESEMAPNDVDVCPF
jgi:hypothetical protein